MRALVIASIVGFGACSEVPVTSPETFDASALEPFCGDGHVDPGEACDDGNSDDNDACAATTAL